MISRLFVYIGLIVTNQSILDKISYYSLFARYSHKIIKIYLKGVHYTVVSATGSNQE